MTHYTERTPLLALAEKKAEKTFDEVCMCIDSRSIHHLACTPKHHIKAALLEYGKAVLDEAMKAVKNRWVGSVHIYCDDLLEEIDALKGGLEAR